jgi:hypothetical protein
MMIYLMMMVGEQVIPTLMKTHWWIGTCHQQLAGDSMFLFVRFNIKNVYKSIDTW